MKRKKDRVIERLRRLYPGGVWSWDSESGRGWECTGGPYDGMQVRAYAHLTPKYDGDDESYMVVYEDQEGRNVFLTFNALEPIDYGKPE